MTDQEAKDLLAQSSVIWKSAESSIRDMKITLSKYKGEKSEQEQRLRNLDNLLNLSHKQAKDLDYLEDLSGEYLMKIGKLKSKLTTMQDRYRISEEVNGVGVDKVVDDYLELLERKIKKQ